MPVTVQAKLRRMSQAEFGEVAYRVMECIFAIHNEMGRFLSEDIYRDTIANRLPDVRTEVPVEVQFEQVRKLYFIDLLIADGAVFELKAVGALGARQRSQLLNYLFLTGLSHGKLVNMRAESVEHEFVNTTVTLADRIRFDVEHSNWQEARSEGEPLASWFVRMLRDLGTGLDLALYESAVTDFLGGEHAVVQPIEIRDRATVVGTQKLRLAGPASNFTITCIDDEGRQRFERHARRFLKHTLLDATQWINVTANHVAFTTLVNDRKI